MLFDDILINTILMKVVRDFLNYFQNRILLLLLLL